MTPNSVRLQIPNTWGRHDVFHVSNLKLFRADPYERETPYELPEIYPENQKYIVESILDDRWVLRNKRM